MDDLHVRHPDAQFLFVIEGVLMYFPNDTVRALFQSLAARFHGSEIAFDLPCTIASLASSALRPCHSPPLMRP
ncbi:MULTISPECIES: hypothetical protein [Eikenella]|uniref:hypothetical protein n=1 Tax=Eikenella TaxID=538 RepID=UPI000ABC90FA|nr:MULTISPECIES: hypothetical protein [Eikenella]